MNKTGLGFDVSCDSCKKKVYITSYTIIHRTNHFCSQTCYWKWKKGKNIGNKNHFFGNKHSTISKYKMSKSATNRWKKLDWPERLKLLRGIPVENTNIEVILQKELNRIGINYFTHYDVAFGKPDIFISPDLCIFVDGCYWHSCPEHYSTNGHPKAKRRDNKVNKTLLSQRYKILRFWEHDINNNLDICIKKIKDTINNVS